MSSKGMEEEERNQPINQPFNSIQFTSNQSIVVKSSINQSTNHNHNIITNPRIELNRGRKEREIFNKKLKKPIKMNWKPRESSRR